MFPVSLDCLFVSFVFVSRLSVVLCLSYFCVFTCCLAVFLMFPVSLDCPMFCLPSVSCVPDVSSVSRLSVVLCLSYFCVLCS